MIDFDKDKIIQYILNSYYETCEVTLDTADFVPEKFNNKILKYLYRQLIKKPFWRIRWRYKSFKKAFIKEYPDYLKKVSEDNKIEENKTA